MRCLVPPMSRASLPQAFFSPLKRPCYFSRQNFCGAGEILEIIGCRNCSKEVPFLLTPPTLPFGSPCFLLTSFLPVHRVTAVDETHGTLLSPEFLIYYPLPLFSPFPVPPCDLHRRFVGLRLFLVIILSQRKLEMRGILILILKPFFPLFAHLSFFGGF